MALRPDVYVIVEDMVNGLISLMNSEYKYPVNLGSNLELSVNQIAQK